MDYKGRHGDLPQRLSDLVPTYISSTNLSTFYTVNEYTQQRSLPDGWDIDPLVIDEASSYVYLGTNGPNGVIAFERTNLWKSAAFNSTKVAVLFSDFHAQYVSIDELQEWFRQRDIR